MSRRHGRAALVAALLASTSAATIATAAPRKVLVLRADGKADSGTRARVDTAVLDLARHLDGEITQAEITYTDAAAAVGCSDSVATCAAALVDGLGSDEVVVVETSPLPGGEVMVTVTRVSPAGAREATATVPALAPDRPIADAIGPLFGARPVAAPAAAPVPASGSGPAAVARTPAPAVVADPFAAPAAPIAAAAEPTEASDGPIDPFAASPGPAYDDRRGAPSNTLAYAAMGSGGALVVVGLALWGKTASLASEIGDAPTRTRDDFAHLEDLESRADAYSRWGNITFVAGAALAGVGAYLWWRNRAAADRPAVVTPFVLDHGAGLAFTFGAAR